MSNIGNYNLGETEKRDAIIQDMAEDLRTIARYAEEGHKRTFNHEFVQIGLTVNKALGTLEAA